MRKSKATVPYNERYIYDLFGVILYKKCPMCLQMKPIEHYGIQRDKLDGHFWHCRPCNNEWRRKYYNKWNKDHYHSYHKPYYEKRRVEERLRDRMNRRKANALKRVAKDLLNTIIEQIRSQVT